jgi:hypothetical protein
VLTVFCIIAFLFSTNTRAQIGKGFIEVEIESPFRDLLLSNVDFMQEGGAQLLEDEVGGLVLIGIARLVPEDKRPETMLKVRRAGEILARAAILELRNGIEITTSRGAKEQTLSAGCGSDKVSLSNLFQVTETRVEGVIEQLPAIGTWWSSDRKAYHVAVGKIVDVERRQAEVSENTAVKNDIDILPDMEGEQPFLSLLRASPVLRRNGGVRGFLLNRDNRVLIAVGSAPLRGSRVKARRIAQLKAVRSLLGHNRSIQLSSVEYLSDHEHLRISGSGEEYIMLSQFLSVQEERVSGIVQALPIVAIWEDSDGGIFCVAIGKVFERITN